MRRYLLSALLLIPILGCCSAQLRDEPNQQLTTKSGGWETLVWNFDNIDGWHYYTHTEEPTQEFYSLDNGILSITTSAHTMDRNKLHTVVENYREGSYAWRLYVPQMEPGAQVSVGAFLYADDHHELDFEIGYGTEAARQSCGAAEGDMVACLTNQDFPYNSNYVKITPGWHVCTIALEVVNNKYHASWQIDGVQVKTLALNFGPSIGFLIACSVENLTFMGDHTPTQDHTALFDWVKLTRPVKK